MNKIKNILLFFLLVLITLIFSFLITGKLFPGAETKDLWFYSGIFMLIFSIFFIEPYYTAPTNVISNSLSLLLVLISIKEEIYKSENLQILWKIAVPYLLGVLLLALFSIILSDKNKSSDNRQNKVAEILKDISMKFGSAKFLYSGAFLMFLLSYHSIQNRTILGLVLFWWIIVVIDPAKLLNKIAKNIKPKTNEIGEIFSVQSKKIFLAKLYIDKPSAVKKFDVVEFNYSMQDYSRTFRGIIFDSYLLNQEKWIKILHIGYSKDSESNLKKNIVYKIDLGKDDFIADILERFVGVVVERSDIGNIKFEYSTKGIDIQEGDLVEVKIGDRLIFYQVINGVVNKELLESKNETGFIEAEAIQLGVWTEEKDCFEKFGWVPEINSLVLKAKTDYSSSKLAFPEYRIGNIPGTNFPVIINLEDAIKYHTAILGITGSGKSFISREIIRQLTGNVKVICVDFTGEHSEELKDLHPGVMIDKSGLQYVEEMIAKKEDDGSKQKLLEYKRLIQDKLNGYIEKYLNDTTNNLSIFELPDLSNTSFILEFTQQFLDGVFKYAKKEKNKKICVVIEEAHTIVPETSSLGDFGDYGSNKALVNKIGQIALQGRKYGVGFLVIAQRTANVSKTVLTQCNSVICFQAFDKTSYDFLGNYLGDDLIKVLPNLKPYHAVVVGKAFKSNIPVIVDLTRVKK